MSNVYPVPGPRSPLRRVVKTEQRPAHRWDRLECGHVVLDYDNRAVRRRRCRACEQARRVIVPPREAC